MTKVYVIAEAGINHNGSMSEAIALINAAKRVGADAIKFQTYVTDDICRKDSPEYPVLKKCEIAYGQFAELFKRCQLAGIDFISTPDTYRDAVFLDTLGMRYMKIGSANANEAFVRPLRGLKTRLIVSLGMGASPFEYADNLHCVSAYPAPLDQMNMARVGEDWITGLSDHTEGYLAAVMAVARGATIIEKHFTLDRNAEGLDHHMSLEPDEMTAYIGQIRLAESALGTAFAASCPVSKRRLPSSGRACEGCVQ